MLPDRSKRAAPPDSPLARLPLIRTRELLALAVVLMALLYLIFPDERLFTRLLNRSPSDALNIAYMENLLRSDPHNPTLRLQLAGALATAGDYPGIAALLDPVDSHGDSRQRRQALRIRLDALASAHRQGHPVLPPTRMAALLQTLADGTAPLLPLPQIATYALQLDQPELAAQLYRRASASAGAFDWLPGAAAQSLDFGHHALAAELYFLARHAAPPAEARRHFRRAVNSLISGGYYSQALEQAAHHLGNLSRDAETLHFLIRTARAADKPDVAAAYARRLLALDPAYAGERS